MTRLVFGTLDISYCLEVIHQPPVVRSCVSCSATETMIFMTGENAIVSGLEVFGFGTSEIFEIENRTPDQLFEKSEF